MSLRLPSTATGFWPISSTTFLRFPTTIVPVIDDIRVTIPIELSKWNPSLYDCNTEHLTYFAPRNDTHIGTFKTNKKRIATRITWSMEITSMLTEEKEMITERKMKLRFGWDEGRRVGQINIELVAVHSLAKPAHNGHGLFHNRSTTKREYVLIAQCLMRCGYLDCYTVHESATLHFEPQ